MLDTLRNNAQSWIVKVMFGAIVLVFVFWGVGSFTNNREGVLAVVNDQPILIKEYIRTYESAVQNIQSSNPRVTAADLREMQFKQQILNQLIDAALLTDKAGELGLTVASSRLQEEITSLPAFQSDEDQFDPQLYQGVLRANQLTPAQFERDFRSNLLMQKMEEYISLPAVADQNSAWDFFTYLQAQVTVDYASFSWQDYTDDLEITDQEIKDYYQENKSRFMLPEKIKISVLELTPEKLASYQDVSSEEINSYYQKNTAEFTTEEQVAASHILISFPQDADQEEKDQAREKIKSIQAELDQGADFAELAREHSDCPSADQGGDLGTFSRGRMVPAFEEAAFSLSPGEISQPVMTEFGWHLIKVTDHIPEGIQELDQVKDDIRLILGEEKAAEQLPDLMDDVLEIVNTGGTLEEAASRTGIETRSTDFFSREQGPADLNLPDDALDKLFDLDQGGITQTPIMVQDGYVFAQMDHINESRLQDRDEVREEIVQALTRSKGLEKAREEAENYLKQVREAGQDLPEDMQFSLKTSSPFTSQGSIPDLGMSAELSAAAFAADAGEWLPQVFSLDEKVIVARVSQHLPPSREDFEKQKDQWMQSTSRMQKQQMFQAYIKMLRSQADIRLLRPDVVEN
ncbi:MAG: SurA N-terminal domain-containing protein [Desulfonatronovibrionaceae bacterium]